MVQVLCFKPINICMLYVSITFILPILFKCGMCPCDPQSDSPELLQSTMKPGYLRQYRYSLYKETRIPQTVQIQSIQGNQDTSDNTDTV